MDDVTVNKNRTINRGKTDSRNPFFTFMSLLRFKVSSPIGMVLRKGTRYLFL